MRQALILLGLASAGLYVSGALDGVSVADPADEVPQGVSLLDQTFNYLDPYAWDLSGFLGTTQSDPMSNTNVQAFLMVIRYAEGTGGPNGYRAVFATKGGPNLFGSFDDHPRIAKQFTSQGKTLWTSAAGAYQLMAVSPKPDGTSTRVNTWDRLQAKLGLTDFTPASQDRCAIELISECNALGDVQAGRFDAAIAKCRGIWASLPGATYGQPTKALNDLRVAFTNAGGTLNQA